VQIWESCARKVPVGRAGEIGADRLLARWRAVIETGYQARVCWTASPCGVGFRWPKAAWNLLASMTKGARNW